MKKRLLILLALTASFAVKAQWVNDPATNSFIANCESYGRDIYMATNEATGDTYMQWTSSGSNGYGPSLQRLTFDGTPQWGDNGIRITGHTFGSSSDGYSMAITADNAVVSCFANYDGQTIAVKINADGSFAWGEQGVVLFDGQGFSRAEVIAGDDGGVWALGCDYQRLYMQYVKASGSLYPTITIEAPGAIARYGKMTLGIDNIVFLTYEKTGSDFYTDKEIYVVGYTKDGVQVGPEVQLMASQSFQVTYIHYVVPDGMGGGYAYMWHPGIGSAFNTYVYHYDGNGVNTIHNPDGCAVHSMDPANYYLDAYATVDPVSHDIIIAYKQSDSYTQSNDKIYVNRINSAGERVWDEGYLVADYQGVDYSSLQVDAFEDGSGFVVIYEKSSPENSYFTSVEAIGMDMDGNVLWNKTLSSNYFSRNFCDISTGFHLGQNIVAWVNSVDGGLYGQNIGPDGTMGPIDPVIPTTCLAPENFEGEYAYDMEAEAFGVRLTWTAPETLPLHYNLYRTNYTKDVDIIEIDGEATDYYDETGMGDYMYQLTAVYDDCESDYALTPDGQDFVFVEVTGIPENTDEEIVTVTNIYNAKGQALANKSLEELSTGFYIVQGLTKDGKTVTRKIVVNR